VRRTPKLKPYQRQPDPSWPGIIDAAGWLRQDLGVSKSFRGDACFDMGRGWWPWRPAILSTIVSDANR
jgi:hypothetical protein